MSGVREVARKGLNLGAAAIRHAAWWLRWQAHRQASRELTELGPLTATAADVERPAA
jgi:hypothetical protein